MIHLGHSLPLKSKGEKIGFATTKEEISNEQTAINYNGDAHLLTIAPTGAGKGRSNIIPTCLTYTGSLILIDPKGEAAQVTAKAREKFGPVYIIDPFKIITQTPDKFNPLDTALPGLPVEQEGMMLAEAIQGNTSSMASDPYWDNKATELLSALFINELSNGKSIKNIRQTLMSDDVDYNIAVMMDTNKDMNKYAYELFGSYLQTPSEKTRPCILSTAQQHMSLLGDPSVLETLDGPTSFSIQDLLDGKPMTIYFVIPPNKIVPFSHLLRLWIISLINLLTNRKYKPEQPTLMLLDECGNLGEMQSLVTAVTLLRSYGLQIWMFFQDLGQMKQYYPKQWCTLINNCEVVMAYSMRNMMMSKEIAETLGGGTPFEILSMPTSHGIVCLSGREPFKIKLLDYMTDKEFKDLGFRKNSFYEKKPDIKNNLKPNKPTKRVNRKGGKSNDHNPEKE